MIIRSFEREAAETAKEILLRDIRKTIPIDILVSEVGLGQTKLKAIFKELNGMSIYAFLTHQRIERAKELLSNHDYSIDQVARKVGYDRVSSFSRRFKQATGISPEFFRKHNNKT
jgi:AraC-like DNA-binding protein